jgi:radical SAM protein with 4Fe4S-binding SPASM domain
MCVQDLNIREIPDVLEKFADIPVRKLTFLPVIGDRGERHPGFWNEWRGWVDITKNASKLPWETSFAEDPSFLRDYLVTEEAESIPCYAGNTTFHIKATGDWYPCCLVGGEALSTHPEMAIGNIKHDTIDTILDRYEPECHYGDESKPCTEICQFKQFSINKAAHEATFVQLRMP